MREEIRLGNAALAQHDLETAKQHFQQLLDHGGTHVQEQIATNRTRSPSHTAPVKVPNAPHRVSWQKITGPDGDVENQPIA